MRLWTKLAILSIVLANSGCVIPLPPYEVPVRTVSYDPLPPRTPDAEATPVPPAPETTTTAATALPPTLTCFPPREPCAGVIVEMIEHSQSQILVQAFSFTSQDIASALIAAARRGVDVRVIIDRQHAFERGGMMPQLAEAGIPVTVDAITGLAHSKVMIIDQKLVITGSYNFTSSAEHRNAENLLMVVDPSLAARYVENWNQRATESR